MIAHDAWSISVIGTSISSMIRGSTVTMTVWSSAATNTPTHTGMRATYGGTRSLMRFRRFTRAVLVQERRLEG